MKYFLHACLVAVALPILFPSTVFSQTPNVRTTLAQFVLFTNSGAVSNAGVSVINGNIGTGGGAITGFTGLNGNIDSANAVTAQCTADLASLCSEINGTINTNINHAPAFGSGETVLPGVYYIASAGSVAGTLFLDAQGDPNAQFIFKFDGAFTTGADSKIILQNSAMPCNIFWKSGGAVSMGAGTDMKGTLIAAPGAISLAAGGILLGRMLSTTGAVSVDAVNATASVYCSTCVPVAGISVWRGNDTVWNKSSNWCGGIPTATSDVEIPASLFKYPSMAAGSALAKNIHIENGASLTITGTGILSLYNTINNQGILDVADGTIELIGSTPQTIAGSIFKNKLVKNLKISNNASLASTVGDTLKLTGFLTFGASAKTFTTNGNLTLVSNAAGTASIADITNNGVNSNNIITGNASVERYIPQGRKWRFLSPNTIAGTGSKNTINETWMEGQTPGVGTGTGYGLWITGTGAGFDAQTNLPGMKYWNTVTQTYTGITSPLLYDIRSQSAYMTYIRGDRSVTGVSPVSSNVPTTLRTYGGLAQNSTNIVTAGAAPVFTAIGNPYASAVDLTKLNYGGASGAINIYVWDPNLTGVFGLGGFQTLQALLPGQDFTIIPGGGSYGTDLTMNTLESGQAFFILGSLTPRTISFPEISKTPKAHDVFFTSGQEQKISGKLYLNESGVFTLMDGFLDRINTSYNSAVDYNDAVKLGNTSENVSVKKGNTLLAIECRNLPAPLDTIQINMTGMRVKNYQWRFTLTNADAPGVAGFLVDKFSGTSVSLNLTGINIYDFAVTSTAGSYAPDRFLIVFKPAVVLPVTLTKISAVRQADETIRVKWDAENEINISAYEIQKSGDGNSFTTLGSTTAVNNAGGSASYNFTDIKPFNGVNFYRIKANSSNGIQYSSVVKVAGNDTKEKLFVYPNPLTGREISIAFENKKAGAYNLRLINKAGQTIYSSIVNTISSNEVNKIQLDETVAAGSYQVIITSPDGKREVQSIIVL